MNFLRILLIFSYLILVTGYFFSRYWPVELFSHFVLQYVLVSFVVGLISLIYDYKVESIGFIVLSILVLTPYFSYFQSPSNKVYDGKTLKVSFLNLSSSLRSAKKYSRQARNLNRDLIFYAQVTPEARDELETILKNTHPYCQFKMMEGVFGLGLCSKYPIRKFTYLHEGIEESLVGGKNPWVKGTVEVDSEEVAFWLVHPPQPITQGFFDLRNSLLRMMIDRDLREHWPHFVLGDFNVSPTSPYYKDIVRTDYWSSSLQGNPFKFTWPNHFPPLWIAIDHIFAGPQWSVENFRTRGGFESDHHSIYGRMDAE